MIIKEIRNWTYGIINAVEPTSIPVGSLSEALNFLTLGDRIELRRGSRILGEDAGAGAVRGLFVGVNLDSEATQYPFRKRGRKIEYYSVALEAWVEIGSDVIPADAEDEDFAFDAYSSQAGAQIFGSSPNSSIYKIMVANPGSITDLLSTTYRGYIRIKQSRTFLWDRKDANGRKDEFNPYLSYIDNRKYTTVSGEAIVDVAAGTLAFKAGGSKRTCFGIKITHTASGEIFTDNRDGTLTGDLGATGTINYTTGAFTTSLSGAGSADYQWEDSTDEGLADFSFAATRLAGQGNVFLQGEGGPLQSIETYGDTEYCAHVNKMYALRLTSDDTDATNLIFRDREGIPNRRAMKGTSKGIYYVNNADKTRPVLKLLTLQTGSTAIEGEVISDNLDLTGYNFEESEVFEWGDYIIFSCKSPDAVSNDRYILHHKIWKSFDFVNYYGLCAAIYDGALIIGESITGNVIEAFSGTDDDGAVVDGTATTNEWDLDYPGYLKKVKRLQLEGNIGPDQAIDVYVSLDKGAFVLIGQILGSGSYVDRSQRVSVGPQTLGRGEVGGGTDGLEAYHYFRELPMRIDKFERIRVRFVRGINADDADNPFDGIGYFSVSTLRAYDVRLKASKLPRRYRG